jgi:hypothetical protein
MTVQSGNGWWYGNLWMRKASSLFEMPPKISQSVWVKNYCTRNKITKWFSRFQQNMTSQYVVFLCRLKWDLPNQQNCVRTNSWVHRIQVMVWGWNLMAHFILIWCFSKLGTPNLMGDKTISPIKIAFLGVHTLISAQPQESCWWNILPIISNKPSV